ncbi:three-helix bundle dimerization domain-containing protein [Actinomadura welshii]|uniref:arsenate reductase/protein-tyrosine-phosphatase family protein n=1 Tax=Actinomadura welshii TaxID=3103817 RepID=UPI0003AD3A48|nr:low molecular weight phosphatase family protein [Actinomadura madurae]
MTVTPGDALLDRIAARLADRFHGLVSAETARRLVAESYRQLRGTSKVGAHLVVLAERFAAERLTALAQAEGRLGKPVPEVLFVCDANAGRSQMAAALAMARGHGWLHARSAGTAPAAELELAVMEVMAEIGVDLSAEFPKPLTDELVAAADLVVTLGCGGACPLLPGTRYLDWAVPDPAHQPPAEIRRIRDELDLLVTDLLTTLDQPDPGRPGLDQSRLDQRRNTDA